MKTQAPKILVWDWAVRLGHWSFPLLIGFLWFSIEVQDWMMWHARAGYLLLGILLGRIIWGFVGSDYARFVNFIRCPRTSLSYALAWVRHREAPYLGHNPLGAWMVLLLLGMMLLQVITGMGSTDDILFEGPLYATLSDWSDTLIWLHALNFNFLLAAVGLHVLAVLAHKFRGEDLVKPMLHGYKPQPEQTPMDGDPAQAKTAPWWLALLIYAGCIMGVFWWV
ncbi:Cytochrome b [Allopseudospirillum japonicum]|uniref:Cytochrome b n=1 Tax=Allopseudospirillum japonicum TaxID=64971 RepID=A0A1H6TA50_9GAMM|nr:cytochrome b/b6 domain-containing protein [Allopseudospirillum japonicum]SEI76146.1 Cytochrome b [Allopseudospirillum japonicum]